MKSAVAAGHICLDIIPSIDHHFELIPGRLFETGAATLATGGPVSNTGVAMIILGIPTRLAGKIGDDAFGRLLVDTLRPYGAEVGESMIVTPGGVTSYSVVVNIPGVDRTFLHCPGANHDFGTEDVRPAEYGDAALFHFGYPPLMERMYANQGDELVEILRRVKAAGLTTSLDMTTPDPSGPSGQADWKTILARALPYVDIFLPSADEILYMLDRQKFGCGDELDGDEVSALNARLIEMGVAVAGIKLGSRGFALRTASAARIATMGRGTPPSPKLWAHREMWFPVYEIPRFVGATGAGDATIAGFLAAFLRELGPEDCGRFANAVGACNVQAPDALGGLKSWAETAALLAANWPQDPLTVHGSGWARDDATGIWHGPHATHPNR